AWEVINLSLGRGPDARSHTPNPIKRRTFHPPRIDEAAVCRFARTSKRHECARKCWHPRRQRGISWETAKSAPRPACDCEYLDMHFNDPNSPSDKPALDLPRTKGAW